MYVAFDNDLLETNATVGGKASVLARLRAHDTPVPAFFVVLPTALRRHLDGDGDVSRLLAGPPSASSGELLARRVEEGELDADLLEEVDTALVALLSSAPMKSQLVAVRSSAAEEDGISASYAGQFTSLLGIERASVGEALKACWASCFGPRAMAYRATRGDAGLSLDFSVMVQCQLLPDKAGVLFTRNPLFPAQDDLCHIEANFGSGESVVAGLTTPDSYTCRWPTGELVERRVGTKRRMSTVRANGGAEVVEVPEARQAESVLDEDELRELVAGASRIVALLDAVPQDIEWAFEGEKCWIVQSRPITLPVTEEGSA